jgi:DNA-binding SARP family transcriptional activator
VVVELAAGRHGELVAELETPTARHPLREALRGNLMTALYRSGRQADALAAYRRARSCWSASWASARTAPGFEAPLPTAGADPTSHTSA